MYWSLQMTSLVRLALGMPLSRSQYLAQMPSNSAWVKTLRSFALFTIASMVYAVVATDRN